MLEWNVPSIRLIGFTFFRLIVGLQKWKGLLWYIRWDKRDVEEQKNALKYNNLQFTILYIYWDDLRPAVAMGVDSCH